MWCVIHVFFCQVAGMYQDPSIGEIKVYYVLTKIIVLNSTEETVRISPECTVKISGKFSSEIARNTAIIGI